MAASSWPIPTAASSRSAVTRRLLADSWIMPSTVLGNRRRRARAGPRDHMARTAQDAVGGSGLRAARAKSRLSGASRHPRRVLSTDLPPAGVAVSRSADLRAEVRTRPAGLGGADGHCSSACGCWSSLDRGGSRAGCRGFALWARQSPRRRGGTRSRRPSVVREWVRRTSSGVCRASPWRRCDVVPSPCG
jgi:hypothetical protein